MEFLAGMLVGAVGALVLAVGLATLAAGMSRVEDLDEWRTEMRAPEEE